MESEVYVFTDGTYEQFLAHILKSASLIDKQLHHFDQLKKVNAVLEEAIQEHDSKKEELERLIKQPRRLERLPLMRRSLKSQLCQERLMS